MRKKNVITLLLMAAMALGAMANVIVDDFSANLYS